MEKTAKVYVAGHRGMVGSAIVRKYNYNCEGFTFPIYQLPVAFSKCSTTYSISASDNSGYIGNESISS